VTDAHRVKMTAIRAAVQGPAGGRLSQFRRQSCGVDFPLRYAALRLRRGLPGRLRATARGSLFHSEVAFVVGSGLSMPTAS